MSGRVPMRALVGQLYDGERLHVGTHFLAHADQVGELELLGLAVRSAEGDPPPAAHIVREADERRERYRRRDLRPKK